MAILQTCERLLLNKLTHYCPLFPFYTPENISRKPYSGDMKRKHQAVMVNGSFLVITILHTHSTKRC